MQNIIFISPDSLSLETFKKIINETFINDKLKLFEEGDEIQFQGNNDDWHICISKFSNWEQVIEEYKTNEFITDSFKEKAASYQFYLINYNDFNIMKELLKNILLKTKAKVDDIWIDNDYGRVFSGQEFLINLLNDIHWDWRIKSVNL